LSTTVRLDLERPITHDSDFDLVAFFQIERFDDRHR